MFDWPAQKNTSPTRTSLALRVSRSALAVSVYGPPAAIGGRTARQRPSAPATARALTLPIEMVTAAPAVVSPYTLIGRSRCRTACSWKMGCSNCGRAGAGGGAWTTAGGCPRCGSDAAAARPALQTIIHESLMIHSTFGAIRLNPRRRFVYAARIVSVSAFICDARAQWRWRAGMNAVYVLAACLVSLPVAAGQVKTNVPDPVPGARPAAVERITVHGAALEGNLEGDAVDRDVFVFLPPTYATERTRRYPVVYALHGYSIGAEQWTHEIHVPQTIEGAFAKGAREMIVVLPDSKTVHNGSMYS